MWLKHAITDGSSPVALSLLTISYRHVYYAQDFKQYSLEMLFTLLVVWQAALLFKATAARGRHFTGMVVIGSIGIFFMHAMPFILVGTGLVAFWARWRGTLDLKYSRLMLGFSVWLAPFARRRPCRRHLMFR